ncbi:MAG: tetratricopeptide repeat protein, partial [Bacteroidales bacterium]|nr:tetratricopeptide repeat protein [Bacteroidales bacterium]
KAAVLRRLGRAQEALALCADSLALDKFNYGCRWVELLLGAGDRQAFVALMRGESENYDEIALDFCAAGLCDEADALWAFGAEQGALSEMSFYYWKYYCSAAAVSAASAEQNRICFPNRLEAIEVLGAADAGDARAAWLLGNLWYDKRQYDQAEQCWERAVAADPDFPGAWRCLALVRYNKRHDAAGALAAMERAYALDETDARILMELDQLHKKLGSPAQERLDRLQAHRAQVESRDDLVLEEITLLNDLGRYAEAREKLDAHRFHPWEGGEGKVPAQYQRCRVELAKQAMDAGRWADAVALLEECLVYPEHLGEGKLYGAQEQDFYYYLGLAWQGAGQADKARTCWEQAAKGDLKPVPALYYNDAKPEKIYYQGLALAALGRTGEAEAKFRMLLDYGEAHRGDEVVMDYFAVSLPDLAIWDEDLTLRNVAHCDLMARLGREGLACINVK